jgi:excisionase family DNA binding protein
MISEREWWKVDQVADELQVTKETVRRWIRAGTLPAMSLGSTKAGYRIARADLEAFVQLHYGKRLGEALAA